MNYANMSKLRYVFYIWIHPVTGFEELKYNRKGSILYANLILIFFYLSNVIQQVASSFIFQKQRVEDVNVLWTLVGCVGAAVIWSVSNWMFCTLLDGKGRFDEIWVATCYALAPYAFLSIPLTLLSHVFTMDESAFYHAAMIAMIVWSFLLLTVGMMVVNQFSMSKNFLTMGFTVIGIMILLFLLLLLFTLFRNVYIFVVTIVNELSFRI